MLKRKSFYRLLSTMIAVIMIVSYMTSMVNAGTITGQISSDPYVYNSDTIINDSYVGHTLDLATVPDVIGADAATEAGHIQRLYVEENDLSTVIFKNSDGTKTAYYYSYPVKYIDSDGSIKDISLDIEASNNMASGYVSKHNPAQTVFSQKMTDGITLSDGDVSLRLVPVFDANISVISPITPLTPEISTYGVISGEDTVAGTVSPTAELSDNTVIYEYDSYTSYEYTLTYAGFKEDIVVSEYTGQTEYTFTLYTNGLTLADDDGDFYLCDEEGNIKATVGKIIIFTADEQNNAFGEMTAEAVVENEQYLLTIHLDADYLADEATKYPIRIDPTLEINYDSEGSGAIEDVTINNIDTISGTSTTISAGKYGDDGSVSRILMKFPAVDEYTEGMLNVLSATVYIRDLMCQHEALTLECYPFTGNTWSESTSTTWSTVGANSYDANNMLGTYEISYYTGVNFSSQHYYGYNITSVVQGWKSSAYDINKGIMFKATADHEADPTHNYKTFGSYDRSSNKPYLTITYVSSDVLSSGVYRIKNASTGLYLDTRGGGTVDGTVIQQWTLGSTTRNQMFKVTYLGVNYDKDYYDIRPMTNSGMGLYYDYESGGAVTIQSMSTLDIGALIPYQQSWEIYPTDNGYAIHNLTDEAECYLSAPSSTANGVQIAVSSSLTSGAEWILEPYTGDTINGIGMHTFSGSVDKDESFDYDAYMYSSVVGVNGPVAYGVTKNDYSVTDKATINSTTGELTAIEGGAIKLSVTYPNAPYNWHYGIKIEPFYGCKEYYYIGIQESDGLEEDESLSMNCQGYAFWTHDNDYGWLSYEEENAIGNLSTTSNEIMYGVEGEFAGYKQLLEENWLDVKFPGKWKEVYSSNGGLDVELEYNQWLVAFRVGRGVFKTDYHFWYRTDTGEWSNKHRHDYTGSEPLGDDLPTDDDSIGWQMNATLYYDSDIIYYVMTE